MPDKEIEDYVESQRKHGISDAAIKKALLGAGYSEAEFEGLFHSHADRYVSPQDTEPLSQKNLFFLNIVTIVVFGVLSLYLAYDYNAKIGDLTSLQQLKLSEMNTKLDSQVEALREDFNQQSRMLGGDINTTRLSVAGMETDLRSSVQNLNYQTLVRDTALSDSLQKMSNRSSSELLGFKQQLDKVSQSAVDFTQVIPRALDSVVTIGRKDSGLFTTSGSGVIINNAGYIVTNYHVIDDLRSMTVKTYDNSEYTATVIGKDESWDIAVLKLVTEKKNFEYLGWAESSNLFVGQRIIAVGNPIGLESTVTEGIISSTNRLVAGDREIYYLQTDVAINAGNSGGPLIDKDGNIVGIATMKYAKSGFEGLSFALRSDDVQAVVMRIIQEESLP